MVGRLSEVRSSDGSTARYTYNSASQFTKLTEILSGNTLTTEYGYDNDERPTTAKYQTNYLQTTNYDSVIDRVSSIVRNVSGTDRLTTSFAYAPGASGNSTTSKRISALTNTGKSALNYSYDSLGNISVITQGSDRIEYYYDGLSQLVRENYSVGSTSYTRTFAYDAGGNIQSRNNYPYTTGNGTLGTPTSTDSYGYDTTWRDKLVSFNGQSISYDAIGNPTSYLGKTLTWTMGRQMESLSDASNSIQYTYNENGIRTKKTVNGTTTTYHLVGDVVTMEQTGSQTPIYYAYDGSGNLFLINYGGQNYFYVRNAQNDIIGMVDTSGNWVVEYQYDAWGKLLGTSGTLANTLGQANPYRYRGYRHDAETGLYYLNSRYYDPQVGRFVNADDIYSVEVEQGNLVQYNLFTYCLNNPINMSDDSGYCAANIIGGVIGGVAGAALGYLLAKYLGLSGWKKWALITAATVGGAVLGAFLGPYIAQLSRLAGTAIKAGFQPTISILKTASQAAFKAAKGVNKFSVSAKHLLGAGGRFAKFTTTSQSIIRGLIKTALTSSAAKFYSNGKDGSFYVLYSFGKAIGTKGEQTLKIVFDTAGKIWTAFPVK